MHNTNTNSLNPFMNQVSFYGICQRPERRTAYAS